MSSILDCHILDITKRHCTHTELEYCPLTDSYVLYHNILNEYCEVDKKYLLDHNSFNLAYILISFDLKGISGAKTALLNIKAEKTPLWRTLNGD